MTTSLDGFMKMRSTACCSDEQTIYPEQLRE